MPKFGGVAFCGLTRLHGDIGAVSGDRQHPPLHSGPRVHNLLAQLTGESLLAPLIAAPAGVPVVDHIGGFGGVHAAVTPAGSCVLHLDGQHLIGRKGINAFVLVAVGGKNSGQILDGEIAYRRRWHGVKFCVSDIRQSQGWRCENRAESGLEPLSTTGPDGRGGMRAACGVNAAPVVWTS